MNLNMLKMHLRIRNLGLYSRRDADFHQYDAFSKILNNDHLSLTRKKRTVILNLPDWQAGSFRELKRTKADADIHQHDKKEQAKNARKTVIPKCSCSGSQMF